MTEWGIGSLFNPGQRHQEEEKRRLQSTRQEEGDSSGGKRIDLDSGTVVIKRQPPQAEETTDVERSESGDEAPETED